MCIRDSPIIRPNDVCTTSSSPTRRPAAAFQHVLRQPQFSANRPTDLEAGRSGAGVGSWRRRGSESSTFACPHGPGAAASSDWTAMKVEFRLLSASRARRAHHFCDRLRLDAQKMIRPTRAARAPGRSRGGPQLVVLSLTVSHACGVLSPLRYLPRISPMGLRRGSCSCSECNR